MPIDSLEAIGLLEKGRNAFKSKKFQEAEKALKGVLEITENCVEAYFILANIFHVKGDIGKAIKAFQKVLQLDPTHTDASVSLSVLYNDIGRYEEGQKIFESVNKRVKSEQSYVEDLHVNKKFATKHYELAEMYVVYDRFDEALFEYNKAIALDQENLEARIKVAKVYAKKGFVAKAFEELKALKKEEPHYAPAFVALGILHYGTGNVLEARTEWERAITRDPMNQEAQMYMKLSQSATETTL